ncbi:MAG: NAD-dependent epimerase/dehydratase family protein [Ramlibacter sp.]|jgi:UDP-glucose 4-epimerase|nr:NAD-dependent epimerase/dehydratase family protein [Ramlibacter sp.]
MNAGRYLITGGASLIGSHLADHLLASGASEVVLLDNFALGTPQSVGHLSGDSRVRMLKGDVLRLGELIDACAGMDGIFALAGFLTLPLSQNPALGVEVNAMGLLNTMEAARLAKVRRVVFASSVSVYGNVASDRMHEATAFHGAGLTPASAVYSASKLLGEAVGVMYSHKGTVEFNALRFSSVYGERQHARAVNALFLAQAYEKIRQGERPVIVGDGSEVHDYIHVHDVAAGCAAAMTAKPHGEVFNIVTGTDTTHTDAVNLLLRISGRPGLEALYEEDKRVVRSSSVERLNFDPSKAAQMLDWRAAIVLEEGLRRYVAWRETQERAGA